MAKDLENPCHAYNTQVCHIQRPCMPHTTPMYVTYNAHTLLIKHTYNDQMEHIQGSGLSKRPWDVLYVRVDICSFLFSPYLTYEHHREHWSNNNYHNQLYYYYHNMQVLRTLQIFTAFVFDL